jgi:hypothetical protein
MSLSRRLKAAGRAALWHLLASTAVAAGAAALVFGLWYPHPYDQLSGGVHLFGLLVGVDLVCGPLLTLVLFNPAKARGELTRDLGLVGLMQLAALLYGLWTVAAARPVFLVFELDRFRVVSAAEVDSAELPAAAEEFRRLGFSGPRLIAARVPRAGDADFLQGVELSLRGVGPALRPGAWRPYATARAAVLARARPMTQLQGRYPAHAGEIETLRQRSGLALDRIGYLPVQGRHDLFWVAAVAMDDARVIGFLALDGL